jgi:hypothetical protein
MHPMKDPQLLTCAEFGRKLTPPLTPAAVRAAERAGRIKAALRTESGLRLFERAELERFQAERAAKAGGTRGR